MERFSFTRKHRDEVFVYDGESELLYVRRSDGTVDRMTMTTRQAIRLLADLVYETVKPLARYFDGIGRDSIGSCERCGHRGCV